MPIANPDVPLDVDPTSSMVIAHFATINAIGECSTQHAAHNIIGGGRHTNQLTNTTSALKPFSDSPNLCCLAWALNIALFQVLILCRFEIVVTVYS